MSDPATGQNVSFNVTSSMLLKSGPGRLMKVFVIAKGTTTGTAHDAVSIATSDITNEIIFIADSGIMDIQVPFVKGLVIKPGTNAVYSVLWS